MIDIDFSKLIWLGIAIGIAVMLIAVCIFSVLVYFVLPHVSIRWT